MVYNILPLELSTNATHTIQEYTGTVDYKTGACVVPRKKIHGLF